MRLAIKMLNRDASVNSFKTASSVEFSPGETVDLLFQLVDSDQNNLRYMPAAGATVEVEIPRMFVVLEGPSNTRVIEDPTIVRAAVQAFPGDASIYRVPLTAAETQNMVSSALQVTVTEGFSVKIATLSRAIQVIGIDD